MKTVNITYVRTKEADKLKSIRESVFSADNEELSKEGKDTVEALAQQTWLTYEAESDEDVAILSPNLAVRLALYNRGASLAQLNEIRDKMEDPNFVPVDGVYDLADVLNTVRERRKMSPEDKALKILAELDPAVREAVLARFNAANATA